MIIWFICVCTRVCVPCLCTINWMIECWINLLIVCRISHIYVCDTLAHKMLSLFKYLNLHIYWLLLMLHFLLIKNARMRSHKYTHTHTRTKNLYVDTYVCVCVIVYRNPLFTVTYLYKKYISNCLLYSITKKNYFRWFLSFFYYVISYMIYFASTIFKCISNINHMQTYT